MATYVLIHGAWHGGWVWTKTANVLRAKGHIVHVPTLTGVGERTHLAHKDVSLDTHITDVLNKIKWEGLSDFVLVGHSYGGMVASGVAEKAEKKIRSLVMVDAFVPDSGQSLVDMVPPAMAAGFAALEAKGEWLVPTRPAASFHVNEKDRAWVDAMCVPHPIKCFTQKLTVTGANDRIAKRAYVRGSQPNEPFDACKAKTQKAGWKIHDVPGGHHVMLDSPERMIAILEEAA